MARDSAAQIMVWDQASSYRRGLGAALAADGWAVLDVGDPRADTVLSDIHALLMSIRSASDWQVLRDVVALNTDVTLVALLVDPTPDRHAEALRCGAHGAVAWEAPPETICAALEAALQGTTMLPTHVAQAMAAGGAPLYDPEWISSHEVTWLRLLAQGVTVQELARKAGYSERAQYRVLQSLYGKMRVSNRTEAILQASRWGLLDTCRLDR